MPRIIVTADPSHLPDDLPVLFDETVQSVHLSTGHAAAQLVERLAWAISDAEDVETGAGSPRRDPVPVHPLARRRAARRQPAVRVIGQRGPVAV